MSLLEDKVDSAVASHETAELAKRSAVDMPASQGQPHADEPPSTTASISNGMEEFDTIPGSSHSREGVQTQWVQPCTPLVDLLSFTC